MKIDQTDRPKRRNPVRALFLFGLLLLTWAQYHAEGQRSVVGSSTAGLAKVDKAFVVRDVRFHSASLEREMRYRILFPRGYEKGGRLAVLYLLHGIYGDYKNWDTRTSLHNYAHNLHLLIVMPDADNSWYTNSVSVPADKFEDYIVKDLVSEIDGKYRTIRERHARAIAGLSMGGYGAVKLALKYPELFAFAGSLSGAFNATRNLDVLRPEFREKLLAVFGSEGDTSRPENDVFSLLDKPHQIPYPYVYVACGTGDSFLETNRAFVRQLSARNFRYEYHETPGSHTWEYWDAALKPILRAINTSFNSPTPVSF
jgi:putative tributyrin esterase